MEARPLDQIRGQSALAIVNRRVRTVGCLIVVIGFLFSADRRQTELFADQPADVFDKQPTDVFADQQVEVPSVQNDRTDTGPESNQQTALAAQVDAPVPADLLQPNASPDAATRYLHPTIPAIKMTVRRDPSSRRFLGTDSGNGLSLRSIQDELQRNEPRGETAGLQLTRFSDVGWSADLPYGKYIYIHHGPLLFEDIPVERYGEYYPCVQPVVSLVKFMGTVPMLPYKITADYFAADHEGVLCAPDYQGNLRPGIVEGSYFPSYQIMKQYPRVNLAASLVEAAAITGLILAIP